MNADIAQRVQVALAVTGHDDRAAVGIEPEVTSVLRQSRRVIRSYPWSGKDPLAFGGEDTGFAEQSRIGHNLARSIELFPKSGNADWKIHGVLLIGYLIPDNALISIPRCSGGRSANHSRSI